jgi:hypothetical protein
MIYFTEGMHMESTNMEVSLREQLVRAVKIAEVEYNSLQKQLLEWDTKVENNVYATHEAAERVLYNMFRDDANEACEGSPYFWDDEYTQKYIVDNVVYLATADVEYDRHYKTYYVDSFKYSYAPVEEPENGAS